MHDTLITIREKIIDDIRHRVVKRKRDGSYWYVWERRAAHRWLPQKVDQQNGKESSAVAAFNACVS